MKTQAQNKLVLKKIGIVELNNSDLQQIKGGSDTKEDFTWKTLSNDPNGSSAICPVQDNVMFN